MSKKSIIALITATVLLFTAGVSVGVFLYTRGTTQATEVGKTSDITQTTDESKATDQNQVTDGENQVTDGTQTDDNNENSVTNPDDGDENPTTLSEGNTDVVENNNTTVDTQNSNANNETANNNNVANNDNTANNEGNNAEVTTDTDVNNVGETIIEKVEEQEKLVSRVYWDWWKPMEVALTKSNVSVNEPQISVKKSAITGVGGDKFVFAGQAITYVIAVTNNSDAEVEDIEITDKVPQNTTFVSIEDAMIDDKIVGTKTIVGTENAVAGAKWVVTIPAGETAIARFTVDVNETMLDENEREVETTGTISNVAIANGEESKDPTNNPDEGNETKTSIITANKSSVVTRNGEEVEVAKFGDLITYTITVENTGDAEGTIYIEDTVPAGTEFVSAQEGAKVFDAKDSLVWSITLGAKETVTRTFTVKVIEVDEAIENIANVGGTYTNIEITETAGIDVIKSATGITRLALNEDGEEVKQKLSATTPVRPEDVVTYTITVTNTGTTTLKNVVVTDDLLPDFEETIASLEPKATKTYTVNYKVTQKDVDTQTVITNVATATAEDGTTDTDAENTVATDKTVDFKIDKRASLTKKEGNESEKAEVGDTITYTITVKNIGSITLENIKVVDKMVDVDEEVTLVANQSKTITVEHIVGKEDIKNATENNGTLLNVVTATYGDRTEKDETSTDTRIEYDYTIYHVEKDNTQNVFETETGSTKFGTEVPVNEKTFTGYEYDSQDKENIVIDKENNIAYVYYKKAKFAYTVEYYYDGVKDDNKTDEFTAVYGSSISEYTDKNITGYKLEKVEKVESDKELPLVITENAENNVIRVYYVKDSFKYTVEYYYDGVIDNSKTDEFTAVYGSSINEYVDKKTEGYELEKTENIPLTITSNPANNVIKVYYEKPDISITKNTQQTTANVGEEITYTLTLKNNGKVAGTTTVTDTLPEGLTYVSSDNNGSHKDGVITWTNVTVPANGIKVITVKAKVNADKIGATVTNTAKVSDDTPSTTPEQKTDTATTKVNEITAIVKEGKDSVNVVLVIDLSYSMQENTLSNGKTRLEAAKTAAINFINNLYKDGKNPNATVTVITFNTETPCTKTVTSYEGITECNGGKGHNHNKSGCKQIDEVWYKEWREIGTTTETIPYSGTSQLGTTVTSSNYGTLVNAINDITLPATNPLSKDGYNYNGLGTNVREALDLTLDTIPNLNSDNNNAVIFLSDGKPTTNYTGNSTTELTNVATQIKELADFYSIGFGSEAANTTSDAYKLLYALSSNQYVYRSEDEDKLNTDFGKILEEIEPKTPTTVNGVVKVTLTNSLDTTKPITIEYGGITIYTCTDTSNDDYITYNSATKELTFDINAWNSVEANTKVLTNQITIMCHVES